MGPLNSLTFLDSMGILSEKESEKSGVVAILSRGNAYGSRGRIIILVCTFLDKVFL